MKGSWPVGQFVVAILWRPLSEFRKSDSPWATCWWPWRLPNWVCPQQTRKRTEYLLNAFFAVFYTLLTMRTCYRWYTITAPEDIRERENEGTKTKPILIFLTMDDENRRDDKKKAKIKQSRLWRGNSTPHCIRLLVKLFLQKLKHIQGKHIERNFFLKFFFFVRILRNENGEIVTISPSMGNLRLWLNGQENSTKRSQIVLYYTYIYANRRIKRSKLWVKTCIFHSKSV
jgi:hypothetical protein